MPTLLVGCSCHGAANGGPSPLGTTVGTRCSKGGRAALGGQASLLHRHSSSYTGRWEGVGRGAGGEKRERGKGIKVNYKNTFG